MMKPGTCYVEIDTPCSHVVNIECIIVCVKILHEWPSMAAARAMNGSDRESYIACVELLSCFGVPMSCAAS